MIAVALLVVASALCASCGRALPAPPYDRAFVISARAPRVLESFEERIVPVEIANTGRVAWDPSRVHLSYHWLWLIPRELALRSRLLPYQQGIRTELPGVMPPGATMRVDGRVLAPRIPGLYWLQWDVVEEGVTWFSQVSPPSPRVLVAVVPIPAELFAPLPLIVALAGVIALTRSRPPSGFAATADVWWCSASLFSKQLILVHEALLEPTSVAYWLAIAAAVVPPLAIMWLAPRRARPWILVALGAFATLLMLADIVYYRFFGDVLSAPALLAARQTGQVWGTVRSLLTTSLWWLLMDLPFAVWVAALLSRRTIYRATFSRPGASALAVAALGVAGVIVSAPRAMASMPLDQMFRNRLVIEQLGPFGYHAYDAWNYARSTWFRRAATPAEIEQARAWFRSRAPLRSGGPAFGIARGRNLIVVQVESLQDFVVDYRVDGQPVMPHLREWSGDSLRFTNVTDQTGEGRTSDAEFVALTSLLPMEHGAVAFRYPGNHYVAVPRVLASHGYATLSAVPFEPGFWNRRVMHPAYGFEHSLFESDFELTEQIGWGLNDRDFLQQMVPHLERLPRPFAAWLITLSLHHPFADFPSRYKVLKLGALEGTSFGNYLHTMRFFDDALEDFRKALARDHLLDDSVIALFGDHDAGFAHDAATSAEIGTAPTEIGWEQNDRVPFLIRVPGLRPDQADLSRAQASPAGQSDFAPTLLALLGIDPEPLPYVGRNLLVGPDHSPIVRPYGDWIDEGHVFIRHGSADQSSCYDRATSRPVDSHRCTAEDLAARHARDTSRLVIVDDLQQRLLSQ